MLHLKEGAEHEAASKLMKASSDLIAALDKFKEVMKESPKVRQSVTPHFESLETVLKDKISRSPMEYVSVVEPVKEPKPEIKKVSLKPTNKVM